MKKIYENWTNKEIEDYLIEHNILVLFDFVGITDIYCKDKLSDLQKNDLIDKISQNFGGHALTDQVCSKIIEFVSKWYNKNIKLSTARVINGRKK